MDLGANEWTTFQKVTLPLITPAVLAAFLLCFAISVDDFVVTYFNCGLVRDVPDLRLGRGAHRRTCAGQRDRHGDLHDRHLGSARQRAHPDAPREERLSPPSVEPRLPSWWLEDALARRAIRRRRPRLRGTRPRTWRSSAAATPGCGPRSRCASARPSCGSRCSRRRSAGTGRAGATAASSTATGRRFRRVLPVLGEERALELARAGEQIIPGIRAWAEARGEDVWLREAGMLEVSAAPAQDASSRRRWPRPRAWAARAGRRAHAAKRWRSGSRRRSSAAASSIPSGRPSIRACSCGRCGGRRSTPA